MSIVVSCWIGTCIVGFKYHCRSKNRNSFHRSQVFRTVRQHQSRISQCSHHSISSPRSPLPDDDILCTETGHSAVASRVRQFLLLGKSFCWRLLLHRLQECPRPVQWMAKYHLMRTVEHHLRVLVVGICHLQIQQQIWSLALWFHLWLVGGYSWRAWYWIRNQGLQF